jgi:hypothetical protein
VTHPGWFFFWISETGESIFKRFHNNSFLESLIMFHFAKVLSPGAPSTQFLASGLRPSGSSPF